MKTARPVLFLSHASEDDAVVRQLQQALAELQQPVWIDSRQLKGGDALWPEIQRAIEAAGAFAVLLSPAALQSSWVADELEHALLVQQQRRTASGDYPVIPLSLDGTRLGFAQKLFGGEPLYIPLSSQAGGIDAALRAITTALGLHLPAEFHAEPAAPPAPLEELLLELSEPRWLEQGGKRRPSARARLVYQPGAADKTEVSSPCSWTFTAPLGPIELEDIRWYLEQYAIWPATVFKTRAEGIEAKLADWGRALYAAALPQAHCQNPLQAWRKPNPAQRRFSVYLQDGLHADADADQQQQAQAAATALLGLPWELLHDEHGYLFQGAQPSRVRRRLPNSQDWDAAPGQPPIRILLATTRPEDDACGYVDHRICAKPLVKAVETLGGLAELSLLDPPTYPALLAELRRARDSGQSYHVLHFDGHGVYSPEHGLGGLCFEHPQDKDKLQGRRHQLILTDRLSADLHGLRIPLVFLEACQTAQGDNANGSVASALLKAGVASVIAMTHSVLVETAWRFVETFYGELAQGARVGAATLAAQQRLHDDSFRDHVFGAGELRLQDWFVPVLYQEKHDPQLFQRPPAEPVRQDIAARIKTRQGALPAEPITGFIGRSRELLALQRLLARQPYALLRGNGGEGKTALAAEFARWMVSTRQVRRAAFVCVEQDSHPAALLNALAAQLVGEQHRLATPDNMEPTWLELERALLEQRCLLVIDNLEALLPAADEEPGVGDPLLPKGEGWDEGIKKPRPFDLPLTPTLSQGARGPENGGSKTPFGAGESTSDLAAILDCCRRLNGIAHTRVLFTSREALPAPFENHGIELRQLHRDDAIKLVERVLQAEGVAAGNSADREAITALVEAVHCHARSLALLAEPIRRMGVAAACADLAALMAAMHKNFPYSREHSLYASLELSLRRLPPPVRERLPPLALFHGEVDLDVLRAMTEWDVADIATLGQALCNVGLATHLGHDHLRLAPALCPYLRAHTTEDQWRHWQPRWRAAMLDFVKFLVQQRSQNTELAARLCGWELPNLLALLEAVHVEGEAAATVDLCTSLYQLLQNLNKPQALARLAAVRDAAAQALGEHWSHAAFQAEFNRAEQLLAAGRLPEALAAAHGLQQRSAAAGEDAYENADYDRAMACILLGRVLRQSGSAGAALPWLQQAQQGFEAIAQSRDNPAAAGMATAALTEQGNCLIALGRLDAAAALYEEAIRRGQQQQDQRGVAVDQGQLGTLRLLQRDYPRALAAYQSALANFTALDEPGSIATIWHQIGMMHQEAGEPAAAEQAYRRSLALKVRLGGSAGQANTLNQLGLLYNAVGRLEEAAAFYRQTVDKYAESGDAVKEGAARGNLADTLRQLGRLEEARGEIRAALRCLQPYGHAAEPWKAHAILSDIERAAGLAPAAAAAREQAIAAFLAYRRDGGENHEFGGRWCAMLAEALAVGQGEAIATELAQLRGEPDTPSDYWPLLDALLAIAAGARDPALAAHPELDYDDAAEIRLLLERLA